MKKVLKKLNNRRGASVIVAILLFMLCALAGVSALTMAAANAGRYSHADEDRQPYYSVTSAAFLIADLLDGMNYKSEMIEHSYTHAWTYDSASGGRVATDEYTLSILTDARDPVTGAYTLAPLTGTTYGESGYRIEIPHRMDGDVDLETATDTSARHSLEKWLAKEILLQCDRIVPYLSVPREWYSSVDKVTADGQGGKTSPESYMPSTLNYSFSVVPEGGNPVDVKLVMNATYDLLFSFAYRGADGASYGVNLYWRATVEETAEKGEPIYSYTESGETASITIKDSKQVRVTWNKADVTISRGAVEETEGTNA